MYFSFEKWHGALNDFVIVWISDEQIFRSLIKQAPHICSRKGGGVGADGIIVLHTAASKDLLPQRLSVINSDGSLANTCGNGIRCAALSVLSHHKDNERLADLPDAVCFELADKNVVSCRFMGDIKGKRWPYVCVEMGIPKLNEELSFYADGKQEVARVAESLGMMELTKDFGICNISNNHLVFFLDKVSRELMLKVGPVFQQSKCWDGINVHFVASKPVAREDQAIADKLGCPLDELYEVYIWERGAAETPACGSGASAIGSLIFHAGMTSRKKWVGIDMPGGRLYVRHTSAQDQVVLAGPGQLVFTGKIEI